jgi:DNA-binding response OmpR family regulator
VSSGSIEITGRPRALVADDDIAIRVLVTRILTRSGFDVDTVPDGAEAIEHILQREYGVIVLDLMMPRVDGYKVIEYFNGRPEILKRIVVMTAFGATGTEKISGLVTCCIEKPFEVSHLANQVKAVFLKTLPQSAPAAASLPGVTDAGPQRSSGPRDADDHAQELIDVERLP